MTQIPIYSPSRLAVLPMAFLALAGPLSAQTPMVPFSVLYSNDFESNTVGQSTGANPAVISGFRFGFPGGVIRDSSVLAPFEAENQYLELSNNNVANPNSGYRAILNGVLKAAYTAAPVGISFDFNESTATGFHTDIGFGTAATDSAVDLNGNSTTIQGGVVALRLRNGAVEPASFSQIISGTPPTFEEGKEYRITLISNFTVTSQEVMGPDGDSILIEPLQFAFWMYDPVEETYSSPIVVGNNNSAILNTHLSFIFRHFSTTTEGQRQTVYIDDLQATSYSLPVPKWTGGGADALWSTTANWLDDLPPEAGERMIFSGNTNRNPNNDLPEDSDFTGITFDNTAGEFTLQGNRILFGGTMLNESSSTQVIEMEMELADTTFNTSAGEIYINEEISGSGNITKSGTGILRLTAASSNTGLFTVSNGQVFAEGDQTQLSGGWSVGPSGAPAATLHFPGDSTHAIPSGKTIRIGNTASAGAATQTLNSEGFVENEGTLYVGRPGILNILDGSEWQQFGIMSINGQGGFDAIANINNGGLFTYEGTETIKLNPAAANAGKAYLNINGGTLRTGIGFERTTTPSDLGFAQINLSNKGTLQLTADVAALTNGVLFTIGSGDGFIHTNGFNGSISAPVTGSGSLVKTGAGTLTLTAPQTYEGDTLITQGILSVNNGTFSENSGVFISSGATLNLNFTGTNKVAILDIAGATPADGVWGAPGAPGATFTSTALTGTGLLLVGEAVVTDTYQAWIDSFTSLELEADKEKSADPDGDGLSNFAEFAMDGNPASGVSNGKLAGKVAMLDDEQAFTFTLPMLKGAVAQATTPGDGQLALVSAEATYIVHGTKNLAQEKLDVVEVTGTDADSLQSTLPPLSDTDAYEYRSFRLVNPMSGESRGFMQVEIIDPSAD